MKHEQRKSPAREPHAESDQQDERRSPASKPSGRKIDSLKIEPAIELHRSSSGRNIRLKHSKAASSPSPHGLTPRAPEYKKPPPELARKRSVSAHETSLERDEDDEEHHRSRDRYRSLTPTATVAAAAAAEGAASPPSNQAGSVPKPRKSSTKRDDRRSSFMIPEQVLEQLGFVRSSTPEPENETNQENDEDLEEKAPVPLLRIQEDVSSEAPPPPPPSPPPQQDSLPKKSGGGVYQFALWKKAGRNHTLVDAISGYDSAPSPTKPSPPKPSPLKRRSSSADHSTDNISVSSHYEATRNATGRSGSGRPRAHIDISSSTESLSSIIDQRLSITRSTSPVIGSGRSSLRSFALPPLLASDDAAISRWRRGELIGEGTFGRVYMGLNAETGAQFALKEIEIRSVANEDQMGQLQKLSEEIEVMHNLRHDNIVRYKGSHRTENHFYIFMEYISGGSIASMLVQFDAFNEEIVRKFTRQIIDGVKYLHEQGIIHRDIKGANVLVTEHGVAKLADFGCSKRLPEISTTSLEESLRSIRGSIPWMAPEVVQQTGHTFKADIWSVGATVIEMATGKHPWPTITSGLAALYTIATTKTSPPIPDHLSDEAKSFLARCFCVNPEERATAAELAQHPFLRWR